MLLLLLSPAAYLRAEGSRDLVSTKGYRLFFNAQQRQQIKVYAGSNEFIQVGSSHVGVAGGFIRVIRPNGTVHTIFNNNGATAGLAIIHNRTQELNGPSGGGTLNGPGYVPGVIAVQPGEEGIWTVLLEYPVYSTSGFTNVLNTENWERATHQPTNQRVVLAWDVTVAKWLPVNQGGEAQTGRVYTQEYVSIVNNNGYLTDAQFYAVSRDGLHYRIRLEDIDPWSWFLASNNRGLTDFMAYPLRRSLVNTDYMRSWMVDSWDAGNFYYYEPQARDIPELSNNKLFFNPPDPAMPAHAPVFDFYRANAHTTWLNPPLIDTTQILKSVAFSGLTGPDSLYSLCGGDVMGQGIGGYIRFWTAGWGQVNLRLDINQNGSYTDPEDVLLSKTVAGQWDSLFWDGHDGLGVPVPAQKDFPLRLRFEGKIFIGEMHLLLFDLENVQGSVALQRLNGANPGPLPLYYDHHLIGGTVSGGGTPGDALPGVTAVNYDNNLGDERLLDFWTYLDVRDLLESVTLYIDIVEDCIDPELDSDDDGILDFYDLDDDNDGVPDYMEYCGGTGFACLPGGFDPSGDEDKDKIPNYRDADDPAFVNPCPDLDGDGMCDQIAAIYDTDGDGIPDHLDLDSDNDGIADLYEAGHGAPDVNRNGRIDGSPSDFGDNGFFNALSTKPNGQDAKANYLPRDSDGDGIYDRVDLDSDNDGIYDVAEMALQQYDSNDDGRLDNGAGHTAVDAAGIHMDLSPTLGGQMLPLPLDTDGDGLPDYRDLDSDNDGLFDVLERLGPDGDGNGILGHGQIVVDSRGCAVSDALGNPLQTTSHPLNTDQDGAPDFQDRDSDGDGIWDTYEAGVTDTDYDGVAGAGVPVVNSRGVPVTDGGGLPIAMVQHPPDFDDDGLPDYRDTDSDNDSIGDGYECFDFKNGYTQLPCLDTDGDGREDRLDLDSDNDGLPDVVECPGGDNPDCPDSSGNGIDDFRDPNMFFNEDTDGDGIPNSVDLDNDNDGIPDDREFCPLPGFACLPGGVHPDGDEDGDLIPNYMDADDPVVNNPCDDTNGDGICDRVHPVYDYDGDGIANHNDLDSDNDGIPDLLEAGHTAPDLNGDGMIDGPVDAFGLNGLYNAISTHPHSPTAQITYPLRDSDLDKVHDFRDLDSDNDGLHDVAEAGFGHWDSTNDGRIDNGLGVPDIGWMGIPRVVNKYATGTPIPMPRDSDGDNIFDFRDLDSDNDGIHDVTEQKVADPDGDGRPGVSPLEVDAHGRLLMDASGTAVHSTSILQDTDGDGKADCIDLDADGDGIPDVLEAQMSDPDQDGRPGFSPLLVNSWGLPIADAQGQPVVSTSAPRDLDGDGVPDFQDIDRDGDGIRDAYECFTPYACLDTDGDGVPDVDDLNSDGDCLTDTEECPGGDPCPDSNGNGKPDFRDFECCPALEPVLQGLEPQIVCSGKPLQLSSQNLNPFPANLTYTWTGPGGYMFTNTVQNQAPLSATLIPGVTGSGIYTLQVISAQGCSAPALQVPVQVKPTPALPMLQIDPDEVCQGDELFLSTQFYSGPQLVYIWLFTPPGGSTDTLGTTQQPLFVVPSASQAANGLYSVIVQVDGCASAMAGGSFLEVLPPASLQAGDDQFVHPLESGVLEGQVLHNDTYNTGSVTVSLVESPARGNVMLFPNGLFRYTSEPGFTGAVHFRYQICGTICESECDTARVTILVVADNIPMDCHVYNILTPNNDGANDVLEIPCLIRYPDHTLRIFNRLGDEVYASDNYQQDWNGEWRGQPLPPGTYFYSLQVRGSQPQDLQGYITIIR